MPRRPFDHSALCSLRAVLHNASRARGWLALIAVAAMFQACASSAGHGSSADAGPSGDGDAAASVYGSADASSGGSSGSSSGAGSSSSGSSGSSSGGASDSGLSALQGPCDIYGAAGTPCVAAHSTVRALYGGYVGPLYQVRRASDKTTQDIGVVAAGGVADALAQDAFCADTTCTISTLYDQSPKKNDMTSAPGGGNAPNPDAEAVADAFPLTLAGSKAYAIYVSPGTGYRIDTTSGIAIGDEPEGEYMVASGKHYDGFCCFDYGNAETNNRDNGAGHMEAVYLGSAPDRDAGATSGPWVMADLENGLFSNTTHGLHPNDPGVPFDFVTAMVKGEPGNHWTVESGDAQDGDLTVVWDGVRPTGYNPMQKEGALILGIGGDNSNRSAGTFFEGCVTSGFPSNATDALVQANIVAAGYGK